MVLRPMCVMTGQADWANITGALGELEGRRKEKDQSFADLLQLRASYVASAVPRGCLCRGILPGARLQAALVDNLSGLRRSNDAAVLPHLRQAPNARLFRQSAPRAGGPLWYSLGGLHPLARSAPLVSGHKKQARGSCRQAVTGHGGSKDPVFLPANPQHRTPTDPAAGAHVDVPVCLPPAVYLHCSART